MPKYRLSQHAMDVVFKLEAQQLGSALAHHFGLALPPVVRHFPTELPVADVHLETLDTVFELDDTSLLHLEFQTASRHQTLTRFLIYDAHLYERYRRVLHTIVFYGPDVAVAPSEIDCGVLHYQVDNVLLGHQDGEATLLRLRAIVARGIGLTADDRLDLIFLPLMHHERDKREVVLETVQIARHLPEGQQRQAVAALLGLGHRFFEEDELATLLEGLMSTNLGERLIERGFERGIAQGIEQGIIQGHQQVILRILRRRFGRLPRSLTTRIAQIDTAQRLDELLDLALEAESLAGFTRSLE